MELADEVYPSVVLLIRELEDERLGFGAGVVVEDGLVLTNQHVADDAVRLLAMRFRGDRTSYVEQDGGLRRYVFEHEADVLEAEMVLADPLNDLALVRIDDPTGGWAPIEVRAEPVRIGEPVFAVGHPQFNPWSLTSGRVSALPQGFIQHDAPLSPGSSGGPLLDAKGSLVGINTSKLYGRAEGVGYARPLDLARILWPGAPRGFELSRDSPEAAWRSFLSAYERGLPEARELLSTRAQKEVLRFLVADLSDSSVDVMQRVHDRLLPHGFDLHDIPREDLQQVASFWPTLQAQLADPDFDAPLEISRREALVGPLADTPSLDSILPADTDPRLRAMYEAAQAYEEAHTRPGMIGALTGGNGVRIGRVEPDGPDAAWVLLEGRSADGQRLAATARAVKEDAGWTCALYIPDALAERRPEGWPPPTLSAERLEPVSEIVEIGMMATLLLLASQGALDDVEEEEE